MFFNTSILVVALFSAAVTAITPLANGSSEQFGSTSNGLKWQATGPLYQGCASSSRSPILINDCYSMTLSSNPNSNLDPGFPNSPRQRIEFLTPHNPDGSSFRYTWKSYLATNVGSSSHFFHLMQIFSVGDGGPTITLDAVKGTVAVVDNKRSCSTTNCPRVSLSSFEGITVKHMLNITYGPKGRFSYSLYNSASGALLMSYSVTGYMSSKGGYLKFGTYRAVFSGMTSVSAAVGDFTSS